MEYNLLELKKQVKDILAYFRVSLLAINRINQSNIYSEYMKKRHYRYYSESIVLTYKHHELLLTEIRQHIIESYRNNVCEKFNANDCKDYQSIEKLIRCLDDTWYYANEEINSLLLEE